ncbi:MAG: hypothetical protein ACOCVT_00460 [bacterium]
MTASLSAQAPQQKPSTEADADESQHVGRDIVEFYDTAVANLEKICDDYRRIKALQLAKERDIAFEEAYENISSVMPILQPIDKELLRKNIRNPKDIQKHKQEVEMVEKEIEMMIDLTAKLLEEIEQVQVVFLAELQETEPEPDMTLEEIVAEEEYDPDEVITIAEIRPQNPTMQALEEAAKEEETEPMKDLTQLMRELMPDIEDLTQEQQEDERIQLELFSSSNNESALMSITDPNVHKYFGRKVQAGGEPAEWMFVNSWYTIGPFPNPMRVNLNKKFPPETVVDLDATYVGKDGRRIKWEFIQSNEIKVTPANPTEYAIWYAYTEIWCDRPMDLWVAVGSDDKANVWLNGMPIWISSDRLKGWRVNEGFRKVSFKPGVNKILYRVENGWIDVGYSLGIRTAP